MAKKQTTRRKLLPRRKAQTKDPNKPRFLAPPTGNIPCDVCRKPGSMCGECGAILCATHNTNPHVEGRHTPQAHLRTPKVAKATKPQ